MAEELKSFEVPEEEAAPMRAQRRPSLPRPTQELPDPEPGLKSFAVPEDMLSRPKLPRKKRPYTPYQDPPEMLIPVSEMTEEMWAGWEWPADHVRLPRDRRKAVLMLWRRDGNICQVCGLTVDIRLRRHPGAAQIDHISPMAWSSGFKNERDIWANVQLAHAHCNSMHQNFDQEMVAVADYRHELRRAIQAVDAGRRVPMAPWQREMVLRLQAGLELGREGPWETDAWRREQELGRPRAKFGEEWPVL